LSAIREILCVDDQDSMLDYLSRQLTSAGYEVLTCQHWNRAKSILADHRAQPKLILVDPNPRSGSSVTVEEICGSAGKIPVVILSSNRDTRVIVEAIRGGARAYLSKPFTVDLLLNTVEEALREETVGETVSSLAVTQAAPVQFVSRSPSMLEVQKTALRVAKSKVPVLITGETGVGKDVIARFIHQNSPLAGRPFVKVNCAAMPTELVESELFGYRKGAFTGAYIDRPGKFEFANNGTIFLDEIGEFTSSVQAKLLQVLQEGQFSRLGFDEEVEVNVRVLAATNRKLDAAIKEGKFREDLYYRLNVVNINISPLRHRREDIPAFCDFFLAKYAHQYESEVSVLPDELLNTIMIYHWPGNVRELENVIKRYVVLQDADSIIRELNGKMSGDEPTEVEDLAEQFVESNVGEERLDLKELTRRAVSEVEKNMILKTLRKSGWNKSKAARELKVSYKTLLTKIEQYGIEPG